MAGKADEFSPVSAGEPLQIGAKWFNAVSAAAKAYARGKTGTGAGGLDADWPGALLVTVRNDSGADRSRGEVLALGASITDASPLIDAATIPYEAQRDPVLKGTTPAGGSSEWFAILPEPIPTSKFGKAVVAGFAVATVNVTDATHTHAIATGSDCTKLTSALSGAARIVWRESGTGNKVAIICLGDHYGYAGEQPTGTYWDGLLSTVAQVIKGDKEFRDVVTVKDSVAATAYVEIRPDPDSDVISVDMADDYAGIRVEAPAAPALWIYSTQADADTTRGTFVYTAGSGFFLGHQFNDGGAWLYRMGLNAYRVDVMSYLGVASLRLRTSSIWNTYDADGDSDLYLTPDVTLVGTGSPAENYCVIRPGTMSDEVKWSGIDRDFANTEYPIVRAGIVVGYWSGTGSPPPPPPPVPPVPPVTDPDVPPVTPPPDCPAWFDVDGFYCVRTEGFGDGCYYITSEDCADWDTFTILAGPYADYGDCDTACTAAGDCPEWYAGEGYYCLMTAGCVFVDAMNCTDYDMDFYMGGPFVGDATCNGMSCM